MTKTDYARALRLAETHPLYDAVVNGGVIPYGSPDALYEHGDTAEYERILATGQHPAPIDPLIWPAVQQINKSGIVWTTESCQGHPDDVEGYAWAGNVRPMLRFCCRKEHLGTLYAALHEALTNCYVRGGDMSAGTLAFTVYPDGRHPDSEWRELLVYIDVATVGGRNAGCNAFHTMGVFLCRTNGVEV